VVELETIRYRGGLIRFRIPAAWVEEYEPDGGGTFYREARESGTLRLNVLPFEGRAKPDKQALLNAVARSGSPEWLSTGNALVFYRALATEEGEPLVLFHWELANAVEPTRLRLALFSYTVPAAMAESPAILDEVQLLSGEIRAAQFAEELGVAPT
jgi:hypothetical protein